MDYIITHGKLKEKLARKFFRQVVAAVEYCHSMRVIHRDIKAENLLLDDQMRVKLIDFGLSNQYAPGELLKTFCGSPTYTAPELIKRQEYQGPEVDVWALGVLLYALVCGSLPFDGNSFQELFTKILSAEYFLPNDLTEDCRDLISSMLVVNPHERITLQGVKEHPWVGLPADVSSKRPQSHFHIPQKHEEFDEQILDESIKCGFTREEITSSVLNNLYNNASAVYLLLLSRASTRKSEDLKKRRETLRKRENELSPIKAKSRYKNSSLRTNTTRRNEDSHELDHDTKIIISPPKQKGKKHRRHHTLGSPDDFDQIKKEDPVSVNKGPETPKLATSPRKSTRKETNHSFVLLDPDSLESKSQLRSNSLRPKKSSKETNTSSGDLPTHRRHKSVDLNESKSPRVLPFVRKSERRKSSGKRNDNSPQKELLCLDEENSSNDELDEQDLVRPRKNSILSSLRSKFHQMFIKDPREARFSISTYSASDQPPDMIMERIKQVLAMMEIEYHQKSAYYIKAEGFELIFEVEVCIVEGLNVYGVKIRRISGDRWEYARIAKKFLRKLDLPNLNSIES